MCVRVRLRVSVAFRHRVLCWATSITKVISLAPCLDDWFCLNIQWETMLIRVYFTLLYTLCSVFQVWTRDERSSVRLLNILLS